MKRKEISYDGPRNAAYDYYLTAGRVRPILNGFICAICRIMPSIRIKNSLYRMIGVKIGKNVVIAAYVVLDPFFPELITIDDNVIIGVGSTILSHEYYQNKLLKGKVYIKKRVLVGADSLIRCGVTIGENSIIAAKSYVNKDVASNTLVGGVPAKKIRKL